MNRNPGVRLGAVTVVALLLIGCQPSGSATPSSEPSKSAAPPSAAAATQTFTSELHGISLSYPESWTAQAATEPWMDSTFPLSFQVPQVDWLYDPDLEADLFLAVASQPTGDSSPEGWVAEQMASDEGCTATEPIAVDGGEGLTGCTLAVVTSGERGYWIQLYTGSGAPATYDRAWFDEVLETVQLQPEDAVDSATSASP